MEQPFRSPHSTKYLNPADKSRQLNCGALRDCFSFSFLILFSKNEKKNRKIKKQKSKKKKKNKKQKKKKKKNFSVFLSLFSVPPPPLHPPPSRCFFLSTTWMSGISRPPDSFISSFASQNLPVSMNQNDRS